MSRREGEGGRERRREWERKREGKGERCRREEGSRGWRARRREGGRGGGREDARVEKGKETKMREKTA